ncbi:hypothetical protein BV22DRAFT_643249 [Leucogyrophana mollusca]|uniref:Uncharacterized protein n=1 Tax=Leucogyrophana mollusca TaxID=85980 RepID=A0ACB8BCG5_9AGAM|nr:hypothetical protein BV22DRAFT_643249 [Leucogyrophana mollusca]
MDRQLSTVSMSALTFLSWELCTTFDNEVNYIWSKSYKSSVKWLFLLTRYIGLGSLVTNISMSISGGRPPLSCWGFLTLQISVMQTIITLVELTLVVRVVALYNQNHRLRAILLFLVIGGTIFSMIGFATSVHKTEFDAMCVITHVAPAAVYGFTFIVTEFILLVLTLAKCVHYLYITARRAPLIELMIRDGTMTFLATILVVVPTAILLTATHGAFIAMIEPWFIAVYSCA